MELEELKASWAELGARIDENTRITTAMVRRMVERDSRRAKGRIVTFEWIGIVLGLAALPLLILKFGWKFGQMLQYHNHLAYILVWVGCGVIALAFANSIVKLHLLSKIDPAHDVVGNISAINCFNLWVHWEKFAGIVITTILLGLVLVLFLGMRAKIEPWRWVALIAAILAMPLIFWFQFRNIYRRNMESISRSLEELKELE